MTFVMTPEMMEAGDAVEQRRLDLRFARRIRQFRAAPVARLSDQQLAEIVRLARQAARAFGIRDDKHVARFVMIDALLCPKFYEFSDVTQHFERASGSADIKAEDVFAWMKLSMKQINREDEVWW